MTENAIDSDFNLSNLQDDIDRIDLSRVDYKEIYEEILNLSDSIQKIIEVIMSLPYPQKYEIANLMRVIEKTDDRDAKRRVLYFHLRPVLKIALACAKNYDFPIEDAISHGFIGLIKAIEHYDVYNNTAFGSYMSIVVHNEIIRFCVPKDFKRYYPAHLKQDLFHVYSNYLNLFRINEDEITAEELKEYDNGEYSIEDKTVELCFNLIIEELESFSIDEIDRYEEVIDLWDVLEDSSRNDICYFIDLNELKKMIDRRDKEKRIEQAVELERKENLSEYSEFLLQDYFSKLLSDQSKLTSRELYIIKLRYGLGGGNAMTLQEIGNLEGISRERIRQIEKKALKKLKNMMKTDDLRDFLEDIF